MPGNSSIDSSIKPTSSVGREVLFLRSEVNYLRSRVEKVEQSLSSVLSPDQFHNAVRTVVNSGPARETIISIVSGMDGTLLPTHYHSFLVNPETSNVAFQIDGDGGFIYTFTTVKLKVKLTAGGSPLQMTRTWFAWNAITSNWSEIGDSFDVSL